MATTSSPASPEGRTRRRSNANAIRSLLPALPRVTSVMIVAQFGPSAEMSVCSAVRFPRTSWMATTSKRDTISARQRTSKRSRMGSSSSSERHLSVRPPSARRFQVPTSRLRSTCFAGIAASSAARSPRNRSASCAGSGSVTLGVALQVLPRGPPDVVAAESSPSVGRLLTVASPALKRGTPTVGSATEGGPRWPASTHSSSSSCSPRPRWPASRRSPGPAISRSPPRRRRPRPCPSPPSRRGFETLDRFEAKLRKQLAAKPSARSALPATVITRPAATPAAGAYDDEDEGEDDEHEDEEDDD